jgi:hypothetical protein
MRASGADNDVGGLLLATKKSGATPGEADGGWWKRLLGDRRRGLLRSLLGSRLLLLTLLLGRLGLLALLLGLLMVRWLLGLVNMLWRHLRARRALRGVV